MTTSNLFRINPGHGTARIRVSGGDAEWRDYGVISLAAGLPVTLVGGGLFGWGSFSESDGLRTTGIVGLVLGGITVLASLPMLMSGSTSVHDDGGKTIGSSSPLVWHF